MGIEQIKNLEVRFVKVWSGVVIKKNLFAQDYILQRN